MKIPKFKFRLKTLLFCFISSFLVFTSIYFSALSMHRFVPTVNAAVVVPPNHFISWEGWINVGAPRWIDGICKQEQRYVVVIQHMEGGPPNIIEDYEKGRKYVICLDEECEDPEPTPTEDPDADPRTLPQFSPNAGFVVSGADQGDGEDKEPSTIFKWHAGSGVSIVKNFKIITTKGLVLADIPASKGDTALYDFNVEKYPSITHFHVVGYNVENKGYLIGTAAFLQRDPRVSGASGEFTPLDTTRIFDTRNGLGGITGRIGRGPTSVQVSGMARMPSSNVDSVVMNVTVTAPSATSYLTIWPKGLPRPGVSSLNYSAGTTAANQVTMKLGDEGKINIYNDSGTAHVMIDVAGYYSSIGGNSGSRFHPVTPVRIADSRGSGTGGLSGGVGRCCTTAQVINNPIVSLQGGTLSSVNAVVLNITAINPNTGTYPSSYLTVWPDGNSRPDASHLNYVTGQTVANMVTTKLGPNGKVKLYNDRGSTDVAIDLVGYYTMPYSGYDGAFGRYISTNPKRILDTRAATREGMSLGSANHYCRFNVWDNGYFPTPVKAPNCGTYASMFFSYLAYKG